jgi:hypothetical protein
MQGVEVLPGGDLVSQGLADLREGRESVAALLVSIGAPRLRTLGVQVPPTVEEPEHRLYERRLVSFERALACGRL